MKLIKAEDVLVGGNRALDFIDAERAIRRQILSALRSPEEVIVRQASDLYDREREAILDALSVASEGIEVAPDCTVPCPEIAATLIQRFSHHV